MMASDKIRNPQKRYEDAEVDAIVARHIEKGLDGSRPLALVIYTLRELTKKFEDFIKTDLKFNDDDKPEYEYKYGYAKFYELKRDIGLMITDVSVSLRVALPHLRDLHTEVPKMFRDTLESIDLKGEKKAVYKLYHSMVQYQYELKSAIESGQSTALLANLDVEFMDAFKMYAQALKSLKEKEDWKAYAVLQIIASKGAGRTMSARDIVIHSQMPEETINNGIDILFAKCKEILTIEIFGTERRIGLANIYAKYEMIKR
jgi:hypothetical protein